MIKKQLATAKRGAAKAFHSSFHLGMMGALQRYSKSSRNDAVRLLQKEGILPDDKRAESFERFEFTKNETDVILQITKLFDSAQGNR